MVKRVPLRGGEKESLHLSLDRHRDVMLWKLEGLTDEQLRRPMTPSGTNLLGLVKHLAGVEYAWFSRTYGDETELLETDPVRDHNAGPKVSKADVVAFYTRARQASDAVIVRLDLDALGTAWFGEQMSLRRVLIGMIEETARHCGHADVIRELLDGAVGAHPEA